MLARWKRHIWLIAMVAVFAGLIGAGVFPGDRAAYAQVDSGHVDVGLILEAPAHSADSNAKVELEVIVVNHGSRTAYDVEVELSVENPTLSHFTDLDLVGYREPPVGSLSLDGDQRILRWFIPTLGGLQREEFTAWVTNRDEASDAPVQFNHSKRPHEYFGEVTTSSFESELHKGNNTDRVWQYKISTSVLNNQYAQVGGNYSVAVSVDERSPSPGDTVEFTITTDRARPSGHTIKPPPIDLKVDIELTDGLAVDETGISYDTADPQPDSVMYSNGVFNVGTLETGVQVDNSVTLPVVVPTNAVGSKKCLTATLTGNPPPGVGVHPDDISDNVAKVCLGPAPAGEQVVLRDGMVDLFTWYDCVGKSAAPCEGDDLLELVTLDKTAAPEAGSVLQPSQVTVHIPDPSGRAAAVGAGLVWSTGFPQIGTGNPPPKAETPGVVLTFNSSLMDIVSDTADPGQWGSEHDLGGTTYRVGQVRTGAFSVPTGGQVKAYWNSSNTPAGFFGGTPLVSPNTTYEPWYIGYSWAMSDIFLEFTRLGTYELPFTITAPYDSDGAGTEAPVSPQPSDTETYTFHVGPIQDLSVAAGGASPDLPSSQTAYTIQAANNGPENSADATVNITLPTGAQVVAPNDDDIEGSYDNGVWTLPGLKTRDYRRSQGMPEEATLTLILEEGVAVPEGSATATISLTDNSYNVCIASDRSTLAHDNETDCEADAATNVWYAAVCVQDSDQTVTTHDQSTCGTTSGHTWTANVCASSDGNVIAGQAETGCDGWHTGTVLDYNDGNNTAEIATLKGIADVVLHAGVCVNTDDDTIDSTITDEATCDGTTDRSWSEVACTSSDGNAIDCPEGAESADASGRQAPPEVPEDQTGAVSVTVRWAPVATVNGVAVSHYEIQRGSSPWGEPFRVDCPSDAEGCQYVDSNDVMPGATYRYRVRAVNGAGVEGAWSAPQEARVPDVPVVTREVEVIKEVEVDGGTDTVFVDVEVEVEVMVPVLPAGPTGLTAMADGEEAIALSWSGPDRLYDHPVSGYEVEASEDGELWTTLETRVDRASYTHRGLEAGSTRHYRVYAHNSEGRSLASEAVQATTEGVPPGPQSVAELFRPLIDYGLLTAVFHYDNGTQKWTFFDPAPEFAGLNTLAPIDLSAEPPVILIVHVRSIRVEFMGQTLYPGWNYIAVR